MPNTAQKNPVAMSNISWAIRSIDEHLAVADAKTAESLFGQYTMAAENGRSEFVAALIGKVLVLHCRLKFAEQKK